MIFCTNSNKERIKRLLQEMRLKVNEEVPATVGTNPGRPDFKIKGKWYFINFMKSDCPNLLTQYTSAHPFLPMVTYNRPGGGAPMIKDEPKDKPKINPSGQPPNGGLGTEEQRSQSTDPDHPSPGR
jgi:hypothetical protein